MKRKRKGSKKSNAKKPKIVKENEVMDDVAPSNSEGSHPSDNDEADSEVEAESPSSVADDLPESSPRAADVPESSPVAAVVPESSPVTADVPESLAVIDDEPESSPAAADVSESPSMAADILESSPVAADVPESSPVAAGVPESSPMTADVPKSSPVAADVPESSPVATDVPKCSPVAADLPESSPVAADVPKCSPVAADVPQCSPVAADVPGRSPVAADVPGRSPVAADVPERSPVAAGVPERSPMAADVPERSPMAADVPERSPMAADLPERSSVLTEKIEPVNPTRPSDNTATKAVYTRVKVKIKSSKALDTQHTSSDALARSNIDKSCQQVEVENQAAASDKMEDTGNSVPESNSGIPGTASNNLGGIKIMSVGISSSMSPCSNVEMIKEETKEKDPELPIRQRQSDKQQLDASLEVIKKVMKMDAAVPFNVPVDPDALNIPDYLQVIKTPMDFGTICNNIENGTKYLNSEDVYKDVQLIWDNCTKYNNKGAYILDLMKRVRKNFVKYWIAADLYCDHASGNNSSETAQVKDATPTSDGVISAKNGPSTPTPTPPITKKLHGLKRHKDGCMCAICVMMRRRQEREEIERMMNPDYESEDYMDEDGKHQGDSSMGSPAEYTSKNMENGSESRYESMDDGDKFSELGQLYRRSRDGNGADWEGTSEAGADHKNKGIPNKNQKAAMYERLRYMENPALFDLCGSLFDDKKTSVWNGPHSLIKNETSTRKSTLLSTISSFMK